MSSELHNIIVVGGTFPLPPPSRLKANASASAAGHVLVNNLASTLPATHRIILVERSEFVIHAPAVVRALVVPGESPIDDAQGRYLSRFRARFGLSHLPMLFAGMLRPLPTTSAFPLHR